MAPYIPDVPRDASTQRLLTSMVDDLAAARPHAAYAYSPISPDGYDQGIRKISYRQFANMVNGVSWWLTAQLGKRSSFQAVTYTGPNDIRQNVMILACSKVGYKLLLASPRIQRTGLKALLDAVDCMAVLAADPGSDFAVRAQEVGGIPAFHVPSLETLLLEEFPHYPTFKTFEESKTDPFVVLHTSGTTALPKPITYTNDWAAAFMRSLTVRPCPASSASWDFKDHHLRGTRLLIMMPPFHAGNIFITTFVAVACQTTILLPAANLPPTVESLMGAIMHMSVDTAFIPPHLISQLATNPEYLEFAARRVETIIAGGAKIVEAHGDLVASKLHTITLYGATEFGSAPDYSPARPGSGPTWAYIRPHTESRLEFRPHHGLCMDGKQLFEGWITRGDDPLKEPPIFKIYTDKDEYCTRDLFIQHPKLHELWKWCGRMDDTICLATGANVSPILMETGISQNTHVQAALMIGEGYPKPALLIEPKTPCKPDELLKKIWPVVESLNKEYFEPHRITQDCIYIVDHDRPMIRSAKGPIVRSATVALYRDEIAALFQAVS